MIDWADLPGRLAVSCLPTLAFVAALVGLDSYKLVRPLSLLKALGTGAALALAIFVLHSTLVPTLGFESTFFIRYVAPVVEETGKALVVVLLIRSNRVGFLVDAAILGFAVGAGFAVIENTYYLLAFPEAPFAVWILRGFGTAVMHGGTVAIFGMVSKALADRRRRLRALAFVPGLLIAIAVHSFYNHFILSPVSATVLILLVLPPLMVLVFLRSEAALRRWLDVGLDADGELLELIHSGRFPESALGRYLQSLTERFRGEVVADLLCYLRLHLELSMQAKGILMMRGAGFRPEPDEETRAKFQELRFLERSIGRTGRLAIMPFLRIRGRDLWQLHMLQKG